MKLYSSYKIYTRKYCQNAKGYCTGQVNFNCSCKVFQIVMAIFQLRYYAHHPFSTCLPNQRLNRRYLMQHNKKSHVNSPQKEKLDVRIWKHNSQPWINSDIQIDFIANWNTHSTSQLPKWENSDSKAGLEKCWSRESLWDNNRNLSLYKAAFADASPWIDKVPVCLEQKQETQKHGPNQVQVQDNNQQKKTYKLLNCGHLKYTIKLQHALQ